MNKKKMSDISLRISCVIIAIILWSFVMDDVNPERTRNYRSIPVNYTNVSALDRQGLVIMEPQDISINVEVAGRKSDIDNFDESNISALVDLSGYSEGDVRVGVDVGITGHQSSVRIVNWEPREILFSIDKIVDREYPVTVVTTGELGENYILGDIDASNYNIVLTGPRTWMNEVHQVVAYVDLEGRTSTSTSNVAVAVVDDQGNEVRGVEKEPNMVSLEVPIFMTQTLPIELQTTGELPENFNISNLEINPAEIAVVGDNRIADLTKIDTEEININTFLETTSQEVGLVLPEGVKLLNPDETVTVSYDIDESINQSFSFTVEEIVTNVPEDLTIDQESLEEIINVNLSGDRSILETIEREDISITADFKDLEDLEDLEPGTYEIEVRIEDIEGIEIEAEPTVIEITLLLI